MIPLVLLIALLVAAQDARSQAFTFNIIAVEGDRVPGSSTESFTSFQSVQSEPALNERGSVAFAAVTSAGQGIFVKKRGRLVALVRSGDPVPGTSARFTRFGPPNLNDRGEAAFFAEFDGSAGLFIAGRHGIRMAAQVGDPVPGSSSGETFTAFFRFLNTPPVLNNAGQVAFRASFGGGQGIFLASRHEVRVVARSGAPVPGAQEGTAFEAFSEPVLNDVGVTAFSGTCGSLSGVFAGRPYRLRAVALTGQPIHGATFTGFTRPSLNNAGRLAFGATFGDQQSGVFRSAGRRILTSIRTGDPLPGANDAFFSDLAPRPALNGRGEVVFEGIFLNGATDALLIQRRSGPTVVYAKNSGVPTLTSLVLNVRGEVAYILDDLGSDLFVTKDGEPQHVIGVSSRVTLEIRPGVFRELEEVFLRSGGDQGRDFAGDEDGLPSGFNNKGQVAFLGFTEPQVGDPPSDVIVLATPER